MFFFFFFQKIYTGLSNGPTYYITGGAILFYGFLYTLNSIALAVLMKRQEVFYAREKIIQYEVN